MTKYYSTYELMNVFNDWLDESQEWTVICGIEFSPSDILSRWDIDYREEFNNWLDGRYEYVEQHGYKEI